MLSLTFIDWELEISACFKDVGSRVEDLGPFERVELLGSGFRIRCLELTLDSDVGFK